MRAGSQGCVARAGPATGTAANCNGIPVGASDEHELVDGAAPNVAVPLTYEPGVSEILDALCMRFDV